MKRPEVKVKGRVRLMIVSLQLAFENVGMISIIRHERTVYKGQ